MPPSEIRVPPSEVMLSPLEVMLPPSEVILSPSKVMVPPYEVLVPRYEVIKPPSVGTVPSSVVIVSSSEAGKICRPSAGGPPPNKNHRSTAGIQHTVRERPLFFSVFNTYSVLENRSESILYSTRLPIGSYLSFWQETFQFVCVTHVTFHNSLQLGLPCECIRLANHQRLQVVPPGREA